MKMSICYFFFSFKEITKTSRQINSHGIVYICVYRRGLIRRLWTQEHGIVVGASPSWNHFGLLPCFSNDLTWCLNVWNFKIVMVCLKIEQTMFNILQSTSDHTPDFFSCFQLHWSNCIHYYSKWRKYCFS